MRTPIYSKGFTVLELMIAVMIVTILATIAYPSYQESILKGKRTEGRAALTKLMQQQELYYSLHTSYLAFSSDSTGINEKKFKWFSGENAPASYYELSAQACEGGSIRECVIIHAQPGTGRVNKTHIDVQCGRLSLNSRGERSAGHERCWQ